DKGMFVDPSGVYFHAEAQFVLSGFAIESEPDGFNFDYDGQSFFEEHIWSALHERSSGFEMLKHVTGWAGLYEVSPDRCGIMGSVNNSSQIFEAHSFSGRGVMQSWAVGRGLSELILNERFETIDLAALSGERFKEGKLVRENLLI
ncbi:MAG TPA: FAD-dependent oxidoreductase, partial [Oligoflexia bacterium]|nr:FAD-dependent oxidoreductase [Oligoflexia bacterium]